MLVVLAHLEGFESNYCRTRWMAPFHAGVLGVDLFFVISGIVIASVTTGKFGDIRNAGRFLVRRFTRIYPAYWVYSSIVLVAYLYNPIWINADSGHHVEIVRSFLLIPSHYQMLLLQGWTLSFEIYFYLVVGVLLLAPFRAASLCMCGWGLAAMLYSAHAPVNGPVLAVLTNPLILEFLAGYAIYYLHLKISLSRRTACALMIASLFWLALVLRGVVVIAPESPFGRPLRYGMFAAVALFAALQLEKRGVTHYPKFAEKVGDWSYSIYLSHTLVVGAVGRLTVRLFPGHPSAILLVDAVSLPAVLAVGYLSFTHLEKRFLSRRSRRKPSIAVSTISSADPVIAAVE